MREFDIAIIGGGPAGLSAALGAKRALSGTVAIIDRMPQLGGILQQCYHKGFGLRQYGEELTGTQYARLQVAELESTDVHVYTDTEVLDIDGDRVINISGPAGADRLRAKAIILATGCRERSIGSLPIYGTRPAGIFTAGSVQRMINLSGYSVGKRAVVLGSGDIGMIVAHHLTQIGTHVSGVFEIKDHLGGLLRNKQRYLDTHGIELITGSTVTELHGTDRLEGVTVCLVDKELRPIRSTAQVISCDTLVTSVGLIPELELLGKLNVDAPYQGVKTSLPWLFICGNARVVHSLVDSVIAEGEAAGSAAARLAMGY